jgi:FtsH-binding integral membrane protein
MSSFPSPSSAAAAFGSDVVADRLYMREVFAWMFLALGLTTGVAIYLNATTDVVDYFGQHRGTLIVLFVVQLGLVLALSLGFTRIPAAVAAVLLCAYAGLTGVTFSVLLAVYSTGSVVGAFAGATGVFAGMAAYGYFTQRDLTGMRGILFGALIGLIVASIAYAFIGGTALNLVIGWAGVIIFSGLTAYDMQSIKNLRAQATTPEASQKLAIFGALRLYLDFINLFISLLRIFGNSR